MAFRLLSLGIKYLSLQYEALTNRLHLFGLVIHANILLDTSILQERFPKHGLSSMANKSGILIVIYQTRYGNPSDNVEIPAEIDLAFDIYPPGTSGSKVLARLRLARV